MISITLTNMDVIIINHVETPILIAYDFIMIAACKHFIVVVMVIGYIDHLQSYMYMCAVACICTYYNTLFSYFQFKCLTSKVNEKCWKWEIWLKWAQANNTRSIDTFRNLHGDYCMLSGPTKVLIEPAGSIGETLWSLSRKQSC